MYLLVRLGSGKSTSVVGESKHDPSTLVMMVIWLNLGIFIRFDVEAGGLCSFERAASVMAAASWAALSWRADVEDGV